MLHFLFITTWQEGVPLPDRRTVPSVNLLSWVYIHTCAMWITNLSVDQYSQLLLWVQLQPYGMPGTDFLPFPNYWKTPSVAYSSLTKLEDIWSPTVPSARLFWTSIKCCTGTFFILAKDRRGYWASRQYSALSYPETLFCVHFNGISPPKTVQELNACTFQSRHVWPQKSSI